VWHYQQRQTVIQEVSKKILLSQMIHFQELWFYSEKCKLLLKWQNIKNKNCRESSWS